MITVTTNNYPYKITDTPTPERVEKLSKAKTIEVRFRRGIAYLAIPFEAVTEMTPALTGIDYLNWSKPAKIALKNVIENRFKPSFWTILSSRVGKTIYMSQFVRDDAGDTGSLLMLETNPNGNLKIFDYYYL